MPALTDTEINVPQQHLTGPAVEAVLEWLNGKRTDTWVGKLAAEEGTTYSGKPAYKGIIPNGPFADFLLDIRLAAVEDGNVEVRDLVDEVLVGYVRSWGTSEIDKATNSIAAIAATLQRQRDAL